MIKFLKSYKFLLWFARMTLPLASAGVIYVEVDVFRRYFSGKEMFSSDGIIVVAGAMVAGICIAHALIVWTRGWKEEKESNGK